MALSKEIGQVASHLLLLAYIMVLNTIIIGNQKVVVAGGAVPKQKLISIMIPLLKIWKFIVQIEEHLMMLRLATLS